MKTALFTAMKYERFAWTLTAMFGLLCINLGSFLGFLFKYAANNGLFYAYYAGKHNENNIEKKNHRNEILKAGSGNSFVEQAPTNCISGYA